MHATDNTDLSYICCTASAHGQATALANIPLTGDESTTDIETLLLRCRDLLKRLDCSKLHGCEIEELIPSTDIAGEHSRDNKLPNSLSTMT